MFNRVIMVGHLTKDIEIRYLNTGSALASSSIATNRKYKKQDGSLGEEICYIDFKIFGKMAETASQYLKKGSKVLLEGRIMFETWSDASGQNRSKHSIMVDNLQFMDSKKDYSNESYQSQGGYSPSNVTTNNSSMNNAHISNSKVNASKNSIPEINVDEDMPF